jgi:hypothetical protein
MPDGRLFVFYYCGGTDHQGSRVDENRLMEIYPDGNPREPVPVFLEHPFTNFMTATERGGSPPSDRIEILGDAAGRPGISYARIALTNNIRSSFTATVQPASAGARISLDAAGSASTAGKITDWRWTIAGAPASGPKVDRVLARGGPVTVELTVEDDHANTHQVARRVILPPTPADLGIKQWGLVLRIDAVRFSMEGGGNAQLREDKRTSGGLSLSDWNNKGHWIEWEVGVPEADDYILVVRYATARNTIRALAVDGKPLPALRCGVAGGSNATDQWACAALSDDSGKPLPLQLSPGTHRIRLENQDGGGLSIDYLELVARAAAAPAGTTLAAGQFTGLLLGEGERRYVVPFCGRVHPSTMNPDGGFCYTTPLGTRHPGDGIPNGPPSTMRFFEDGKQLGPAHAVHVDIRNAGAGRFSHWKTALYFSASDNSDPRTNGRKYEWQIIPPSAPVENAQDR